RAIQWQEPDTYFRRAVLASHIPLAQDQGLETQCCAGGAYEAQVGPALAVAESGIVEPERGSAGHAVAVQCHWGRGLEGSSPGAIRDPEAAGAVICVSHTQLEGLRHTPIPVKIIADCEPERRVVDW